MAILLNQAITGIANSGNGRFSSSVQLPSTAAWSEGFEAYANAASLTTVTGMTNTAGVVDTTQAHSGTKSAKHSMTLGSDMALQYGFARDLPAHLVEGDEFWIQGWFYYPTGFDFGNNGNVSLGGSATRSKFFRLQTFTAANANRGYNDVYLWKESASVTRWQWIYEGIQQWAFDGLDGFAPGRPAAPNTSIVRGTWIKVEYYVKLHHTPGQAIVRLWENNVLALQITDLETLVSATDYASLYTFSTYYNGGAPATQSMFTDDWKVYTSASPPTGRDAANNVYIG